MNDSETKIYPRCKADMSAVYISAEGTVYPCCWLGNFPHSKHYRVFHGDSQLDQLNVNRRKLKDILQDPLFRKVERSWDLEPFDSCKNFCSKPLAQPIDRMNGTNEVLTLKIKK
jgi:MoaA/NifB/PqqE/SkfB family radical SAM enzyme